MDVCLVIDLLLWRDVKKTGIVSASTVVLLLALSCCSVLSVIAYFGLVVLTLSITFRLYCHVMGMMNRSTDNLAPLK
jgi:Reticulon